MVNCNRCGKKGKYMEKYDAYYCKDCNLWLESTCKDKTCLFCNNRPKSPMSKKPSDRGEKSGCRKEKI